MLLSDLRQFHTAFFMFFSAATGAGIITANFRFGADKRLLLFGVIRYILIPILIHVFIPVLISARLIMVPVVIIVTFHIILISRPGGNNLFIHFTYGWDDLLFSFFISLIFHQRFVIACILKINQVIFIQIFYLFFQFMNSNVPHSTCDAGNNIGV